MKKIDLGQTIAIVANIGVIAGIVFLAIELRQNSELLRTQNGYAIAQNRVANSKRLQESPEFSRLIAKLASGEPLSEFERWQEVGYYEELIINWEWEFGEYRAGRISENQLPVRAWRLAVHDQSSLPMPGLKAYLESQRGYDPEFMQFLRQNVLATLSTAE